MSTTRQYVLYKVKDISLAELGRQEIKLTEAEKPGLLVLCEECGPTKPLSVHASQDAYA